MSGGLLALDLARCTGWAVAPTAYRSPPFPMPDEAFGLLTYGMVRLGSDICPAGQLYVSLHKWFGTTLRETRPDIVAIEAAFIPRFKFKGADVPFGLAAIVEMHCHYLNIPLYRYQPASIKKHWTDNGRARKQDMIASCLERGIDVSNDNVADAIALADFAVASLTGKGHWPVRENAEDSLPQDSGRSVQATG